MPRQARERAGLGLREAARKAGLSGGYVTHLEAGDRSLSLTLAKRIAEALELGEDEQAMLYGVAVTDAGRDHPARAAA
ncbi:hypothetical protein AR457_29905 [Streptomyces agglomeratus]|uniref:HTH cro/C1-type domain-containing protein n=1 Tax=Streptomyces agglomeratus TaxID=285458 RepID=A0A1E5PK29_9ACTN|nr:helix-turn-helix transcriptional regulator [Streptomyces agglomeratus]OEJ29795.1 hypothetical protein AS594_29795 [Streptomyces agglomeratus]OEJ37879.1 hypothetical protein BGK70_06745 [Streptomyces agglomeratus]OEJ49301.1 hypothetical protein AR457_29905 [Streptomyces agglomeratus]